MPKDDSFCRGCRNDFYNGRGGAKECWDLKSARVVLRWKQDWWTQTDTPGALVQVKTFNCHHETGQFAFLEKLPNCAVEPVYLKKASK